MAGLARPTHLIDVKESNITILSSYHEGADPKSTLLNGVTGDGLSNATLLNTNGYIEFSCTEKIVLWACGGYYSDSGGNSGTGKVFIQKKQIDGTYVNLKESNCPLNSTTWLNMTDEISAGTYRIATSTSRYPVFSEFFAQNVVSNKTFILHDGKYKKWIDTSNTFTINKLTPTMTSDTAPSPYKTSASGYNSKNYPFLAFDKGSIDIDEPTKWYVDTTGVSSHWLKIDFSTPMTINAYSIAGYVMGAYNYTPKSWALEGSNNDSTWTILDSVTDETYSIENHKKIRELFNSATYRYYRINITKSHRDSVIVGISELEFYFLEKEYIKKLVYSII